MTTTFTARSPEDLLAAVPVVLGFRPEASLAMLTFGAESPFHARLDLPARDDPAALVGVTDVLLAPCLRHGVTRVALLFYSDDAALAARLAAALVPAFVAEGIGVVDVVRADQGMWCRVPIRAGAAETSPVPFDDTHHPFSTEAVFQGLVTHASRDELRATLDPDPVRRERWGALVDALPEPTPVDAGRVRGLLARWVATGAEPDDDGAALVLRAVTRLEVRDAALYSVTVDTAPDHLRVWSALLRGAPDPQVPHTAALTAFCAWLSGHGALAWCALDRCLGADPTHRLARCLSEALTRALPPTAWEDAGSDRHTGARRRSTRPAGRRFRRPGGRA